MFQSTNQPTIYAGFPIKTPIMHDVQMLCLITTHYIQLKLNTGTRKYGHLQHMQFQYIYVCSSCCNLFRIFGCFLCQFSGLPGMSGFNSQYSHYHTPVYLVDPRGKMLRMTCHGQTGS